MTRFVTLVASALSFGLALGDLLDCGPARYDPTQVRHCLCSSAQCPLT